MTVTESRLKGGECSDKVKWESVLAYFLHHEKVTFQHTELTKGVD